eukprot:CAMPEP_0177771064 /NCGR_PEP_ID=MMETSP0491_2-20121128/11328_1 /TAXON_ID=63592 /ORGANISM="Tetraselmis chuii, Strain PLY429" /LENGTH=221 /DNA_ID=CAMNT_0019288459 /DNA_START=290 /DNA_END=956 /DNA_ORIENTATION=+
MGERRQQQQQRSRTARDGHDPQQVVAVSSSGMQPSGEELRMEDLSKLSSYGPQVSVGEEIRGLFSKALESSAEGGGAEEQRPSVRAAAVQEAAGKGSRADRRHLQLEAQEQVEEFERELQEELEQKVAGLLMEKEHKTAEALKLKTELEGRISQLQLMMAQLDDKVSSYAESYDNILFELRKEYSGLVAQQRNELEGINKQRLTEHMFALRRQRQMPVPIR